MTLIELLVVLVLLGVMAGVVPLSWRPPPAEVAESGSIAATRRQAIESGSVVRAVVTIRGHEVALIAFPDGRIVGPGELDVNVLTGREAHADSLDS